MAKMIPRNFPSIIKSYAEKRLFDIFHQNLSDEYIVFHGTWWQHIKYVVQDREADFIIIHPKKGILILEVKGGQIRYDHFNKIWYQNEKRLKISPFEQAKDIKFKFLDFLGKYPEFVRKDFCIGQCVAFPDIDEVLHGLPSESPQEILLLRFQLNNINDWINSVFEYYQAQGRKTELNHNRVNKIVDLISPSTTFKKYIFNDIGEIEHQICNLTEEQFNVLDNLCLQSQSIILGCAGSGKTQLAIEKTHRLCQHKCKTLVICKSNHLALYLEISLKNEINYQYCQVSTYEALINNKFQTKLDQLDAIIIDEGQDFEAKEIEKLKQLVSNHRIFYIFQDSNQNVYKNADEFRLPVSPLVLNKNCRNTHNIFAYAKPFVSCVHPLKSSNIKGKEVIKREYNDIKSVFDLLEKDIIELVNNEKISPNQIIVLTDIYPLSKSLLFKYLYINEISFRQYSSYTDDKNIIQWSNIGMYKGLESDVIILFLEKQKTLVPSKWDIANRYIGATRAKSLLIIYESPNPKMDF